MFGKSKVLIEGTKSQGVIFDTSGPRPTEGGGHTDTYHIKVRIKFGDGSTTDIKEKLHISKHGFHLKGQTVPVRYDPADHSKVEIDLPELAAQKQAARDRLDRSANARVEQALNEMTPHGGNTPPIPAAVTGDADSRRTILEVGIRVAQRRGDNAQVERLTAQLKQLDEGADGDTRR